MGSWHGTCGVTQLPIHPGDEVALFLIVGYPGPRESSDGHCHSMEFWSPRSIQLYGTYEDYGRYEIVDGWHPQFVIDCFQHDAMEVEAGPNKSHDIEVTREKLKDWEFIGEALHEGLLIVARQQPISLFAIHRRVFDAIVEQKIDHWVGDMTLDRFIKSGQNYFREVHRQSDNPIDSQSDHKILRRYRVHESREIFASAFQSNEGNIRTFSNSAGQLYQKLVFNIIDGESPVDEEEFILEISKFNMLKLTMEFMRTNWAPQCGAGSQAEEYDLYETVYKAAAEVITKRRAVYGEDEEWEDD